MLFIVLRELIRRGQTEGLREKIDVFYAYGRLTADEYNEIVAMLEQE